MMFAVGSRTLMRVPLDFDWPLCKVWKGYAPTISDMRAIPELVQRVPELLEMTTDKSYCIQCMDAHAECWEHAKCCVWHNAINRSLWYKDPPTGEGFQLWETCTEGSPISPVFASLDALCDWAAGNATVFASKKATKEEWLSMLGGSTTRLFNNRA